MKSRNLKVSLLAVLFAVSAVSASYFDETLGSVLPPQNSGPPQSPPQAPPSAHSEFGHLLKQPMPTTTFKPVNLLNRNHSSSDSHPHGRPETIIHFTETKKVIVDRDAIEPLLKLSETLKDYKIAIYSIVGAFRQGKSFLMDYCLRFLYAHYKSLNFMENRLSNPSGWMGDPNEPLRGFSWKPGKTATTAGIVMWSDIFLHDGPHGKIAIVIMDTQGLFDVKARMEDSMKIFALNSLFSSQLIFNVKGQVDEQQLQYLQLVSAYAKLIKSMGDQDRKDYGKPFQNLLYLVRDWPNREDHAFGWRGGNDYINDIMNTNSPHQELSEVRQHITTSYTKVQGFLMPHPGRMVDGSRKFDGRWSDMEPDFKQSLIELIEGLFAPQNIQPKIIMGTELQAQDYYAYVYAYCQVFESDNLPELPTIYKITVEKHMLVHIAKALALYQEGMRRYETEFTGLSNVDASHEAIITNAHAEHKAKAIKFFDSIPKMGSPQQQEEFRNRLDGEIELYYNNWRGNVVKIGQAFSNMTSVYEQKTNEIQQQAERERKLLEAQYNSEVQTVKQQLAETQQKSAQQMQEFEQIRGQYEQQAIQLQQQIANVTVDFQQQLEANKAAHDQQLQGLQAQHANEMEERRLRDIENEKNFNAKIADMQAQHLENTLMYNQTIEQHRQQMEQERVLRIQQEQTSAAERQQLLQQQQEMEARLKKEQKAQKKKYKQAMLAIEQQFTEERDLRLKQEEETQRRNEQLQGEFMRMQQQHAADMEAKMAAKESEIYTMKKDLEHAFQVERMESNGKLENMKMQMMMSQKSGSLGITPNGVVILAAALLASAKFLLAKTI